jgi:ribonuclease P protein component
MPDPSESGGRGESDYAKAEKRDFGKPRRLLKASDFNRVFKQGRRQSLPEFTVAFRLRPLKDGQSVPPRLGLSVSRKAGKSVQRNKLKRRLREIFRLNHEKMLLGTEMVVIPRKEAVSLSYFDLESKVFSLLKRAKLLKKDQF